MSATTFFVAQFCFWLLLALVAVLPVRYSVIVYLLLIQFDLNGAGNYSLGSLGIENSIKAIIVPAFLLWRAWPLDSLAPGCKTLCKIWIILASYAVLSILWSPYPLSAVKMAGYFFAYTVLFLVFTTGWRRGWFNGKALIRVTWCSLLIAVVQTYLLGNEFGNPVFENRFTTFSGAATFAPFLLSLLILLLFLEKWRFATVAAAAAGLVGLLLAGGRSVFVGFGWAVVLGGVAALLRSGKRISWLRIARRGAMGVALIACLWLFIHEVLPENRIDELVSAMITPGATVEEVGSFAWRLNVYQSVLEALPGRGTAHLLLGSGTSSSATIVLENKIDMEDRVDPNRALHDEFLRALYEWGVPGLALLVAFIGVLLRLGWMQVREYRSKEGFAFLAIAASLLFSFLIENVLADSSSPGGVGYTLVISSMIASYCSHASNQVPRRVEQLVAPKSSPAFSKVLSGAPWPAG
jgi:O-antigen ligase